MQRFNPKAIVLVVSVLADVITIAVGFVVLAEMLI